MARLPVLPALAVALLSLTACASLSLPDRQSTVMANAYPFKEGQVPAALLDELETVSVVMLGETHYVAEHQTFLADLAFALQPRGFRLVLQEGMSCDSWIIDEYVSGGLAELPASARAFDGAWLDRIRDFNEALPPAERIHVGYIDIDHFSGEFQLSLRIAISASGSAVLAGLASPILAIDPKAREYPGLLAAFQSAMDGRPQGLEARWAIRLSKAASAELRSIGILGSWSDEAREAFIFERCASLVAGAPEGKAIVNCGMNHAQKLPVLPGARISHLRNKLGGLPEFGGGGRRIYVLAAVPLSGRYVSRFYSVKSLPFDLMKSSPPENILRLMGETARDMSCFLSLEAPVFTENGFLWVDNFESLRFAPKKVFDGLITYPSGSIPLSLSPLRGG